ncbi:MAG: GNAT family N-acetyltransferase [Flavipsychrobacter sp.]|nr:GNAT family N-acetyltransferase [Flavipsychrobacter sp.]
MINEAEIVNNVEKSRFQMTFANGETALVDYRLTPGKISFIHTEVPKDMNGKGVAARLAKYALEYARANNLRINIYCAYIAAYVKRDHSYDDLIDHRIEI